MENVTPERSALMKRVRQKNTKPELMVRQVLSELGARFRVNVKTLAGSPDIANKTLGKAIFVHGCFWHRHLNCRKYRLPENNRDFWDAKFEANVYRDEKKIQTLRAAGMDVLVVWECELKQPIILKENLRAFWFGDVQTVAETGAHR
jgi:DNA mismatch endonuclease (patch repair protein)